MNDPERKGPAVGRSIFLKLLGSYIAISILIVILVSGFLKLIIVENHGAYSEKARATVAEALIGKVGPGMDAAGGKRLSEEFGLDIAMEGPRSAWSTIPGLPALSKLDSISVPIPDKRGVRFGRYQHHRFILINEGWRRIVFIFGKGEFHESRVEFIPFFILSIIIALFLGYLLIRRLFQPLKELHIGFLEARRGNLNAQVPIRSSDELGQLAQSFNLMLSGIRDVMRSKEQLLLDVSHELRSPLTRIRLSLEIEGAEAKEVARRNARELEKMISEILESARLESPRGLLNLEPVEIDLLIQEVVKEYEFAPPGIRIISPAIDCTLALDRARITIVIRNVLENSLKYSCHQEAPIEVSLEETKSGLRPQVTLSIRDFGAGIPTADLTAIFEPFYRVDKSRGRTSGGYGLGLSLCRKIMIAHGGEMEVSSSEGQGTTMKLVFGRYP